MSFQVVGELCFSGGTLYPSGNYVYWDFLKGNNNFEQTAFICFNVFDLDLTFTLRGLTKQTSDINILNGFKVSIEK